MKLRIVCRSHGGENRKSRPPYYSKSVALASLLRASDGVAASVVFVNDGPMPRAREEMMRNAGEVLSYERLGMRGSYWQALQLVRRQEWAEDDLVFFSEDDYLYRPDAFARLMTLRREMSGDFYAALYGHVPQFPLYPAEEYDATLPARWAQRWHRSADGQLWSNILSTTSTFGGTVRSLRQDLRIFRQGMLPYKTRLLDHETCLVYQGHQPHPWRGLARAGAASTQAVPRGRVRAVGLAPFEAAFNLRALRRPKRRRLLWAPNPNLATHLEVGLIAPGSDWAALAVDTHRWAESQGLMLCTAPAPSGLSA